jgi:tetratricopeptide (TPR) repeat protein
LNTWQDPVRKDPVRHISYALNGLGFVALKEKRYEEARRFFLEGIQSAEEFGRVDELAKGNLGLASVYLETGTDLKTALTLINESIESFQQQGMQYELQKAKMLQDEILKMDPEILTSQ